MTKFLLDSGDPIEYKEIAELAKKNNSELWGATTNPTLIAKKLAGKKVSSEEAFTLQKEIVMEILTIVPGAVSAEVYADDKTTAEQMIKQGREISAWHERIYVKLPTTVEGFKARSVLRKEGAAINNTLVFSQEQIYAICLHELLLHKEYPTENKYWPPFISPFLGRLDDQGEDGLSLLANGIYVKNTFFNRNALWMLSSSIRNTFHVLRTIELNCEIMTAPAKVYREWFALSADQKKTLNSTPGLQQISVWQPFNALKDINTLEKFMQAIASGELNIHHPLTDKGVEKFSADWKTILLE